MKPLALTLAALAVAGCAAEETPTADPVRAETDVVDDAPDVPEDGAIIGDGVQGDGPLMDEDDRDGGL